MTQQIAVLTSLTAALLGELELLHSTVAATNTYSRGGSELSLMDAGQVDVRVDFYKEVELYEIALIKRALKQSRGHQRNAAHMLALNSTTLNNKIKHYGIHTPDLAAQHTSHLGFHRLARARPALIPHDLLSATTEPESVPGKQRNRFVKFQDFE